MGFFWLVCYYCDPLMHFMLFDCDPLMHFMLFDCDPSMHFRLFDWDPLMHFMLYNCDPLMHFMLFDCDPSMHFMLFYCDPLMHFMLLCPPNRRWGTYCFWCGSRPRRRPRSFFPTRYLLNQWMDFDQTCIDTWLGGGKELIRFW